MVCACARRFAVNPVMASTAKPRNGRDRSLQSWTLLSPYFRPAIIGHRRPSPQDRHSRRFRLFKVSVCAVIPLQLHAAVMQAVQRRVVGGANPSACQILHVGGVCRRVVLPYFIMASRVAVAFARYRRVRQPAHTSISVIPHVGSPSSWCRHQPGHTAG